MSLPERIPGMQTGSNGRNFIVALLYIGLAPFLLIALPFYLFITVGTNRHQLADRLTNSPISALPGIGENNWKAGTATFAYVSIIVVVVFGVVGATAPSDNPAPGAADITTSADVATTTTLVQAEGDTETTAITETTVPPTTTPPTRETTATTATTARTTTTETTTESTTTTTTVTTTTVAPAKDGESYQFSGNGNDVTDNFATEGGLVVLDFQHDGESNFQVQAVSNNGDEEYLVNHIGAYDGEVALYLPSDNYQLDVTADESWSADVTQPRFNQNDVEDIPGSTDGEHAAWMGPFEFEGGEEVSFEIENDAQAGVWLANHEGEKVDLLHNEIGPYEGSTLVTNSGVGLIIVETDSAEWKIEIQR